MICDRCYELEADGEHGVGLCPLEPRGYAPVVRPDDIPGGLEIHHGLCNEDGSPRTYYSRSEIRRECEARGLTPWTDIHTEDKTKDGRVLLEWRKSDEAKRQKRDRDEARRAGVHQDWKRTAPKQTSEATRAQIKRAVIERLRAYS
jgi:hypothetical protein